MRMTKMKSPTTWTLLAACAVTAPFQVFAQEAQPPGFKADRTAEDYSYLKEEAKRQSGLDQIKLVPLAAQGDVFVSFGGEIRERVEAIDRPAFGIGGREADTYLLQRTIVHADLHLGSTVRLFGQLGSEQAFGKQVLASPDEDELDVQQLFVELRPAKQLTVRLGRQEMAFNPSQRFVSFRDATNVRQNFDGARATLSLRRLKMDAFVVRPVTLRRGVFDDAGNDQQALRGLYGSLGLDARRSATADAYWLRLDRDAANFGGISGEEHRHSLGLRSGGTSGAWDWDVEGLVQRGTFVHQDIRAWALSADLGYSASGKWKPRLGFRLDSGSGDRQAGDGRLGTFNPLFPKGPYFNEANVTSFANLVAVRSSLRVQPLRALTVEAATQWKWKEARGDSVYLGPASPVAGTRGGPREIGQVYSADATVQIGRHWSLRGYYLHHSEGEAIRAVGGEAIDFGMASLQFRF
jgi:hypothetical protein